MNKKKSPFTREQVILVAASLLILAALTVTGVYLKKQNEKAYDGYSIDLAQLEDESSKLTGDGTLSSLPKSSTETANSDNVQSSIAGRIQDTTADSSASSTDSAKSDTVSAGNSGVDATLSQEDTRITAAQEAVERAAKNAESVEGNAAGSGDRLDAAVSSSDVAAVITEDESTEAISTGLQGGVNYEFSDADSLQWPVVGDVLINYSMDKSVYFTTLDQYKYNPAIIIAAEFGTAISSAADGQVTNVFYDPQIGSAVTISLGGGYEATYGQLDQLQVNVGDAVAVGQVIGYVANPTKYFSLEGSNLYFKLTKDGEPVNPMSKLV